MGLVITVYVFLMEMGEREERVTERSRKMERESEGRREGGKCEQVRGGGRGREWCIGTASVCACIRMYCYVVCLLVSARLKYIRRQDGFRATTVVTRHLTLHTKAFSLGFFFLCRKLNL